MEKFEVGDWVERIGDDWRDVVVGGVYKVQEVIPTGIKLDGLGTHTYDSRWFVHSKEMKVLEILRQWKDSR